LLGGRIEGRWVRGLGGVGVRKGMACMISMAFS